jgi:hypothetical protein
MAVKNQVYEGLFPLYLYAFFGRHCYFTFLVFSVFGFYLA